eukprot:Clim_evm104s25 gene=Clim_evmTU104s25
MDKDRSKLEDEQLKALKKAITPEEDAPKPKHVRSAIIVTHEHRTSDIFWTALRKIPLGTDQVVAWKGLIVIHKLLQDGWPGSIQEFIARKDLLRQLGAQWGSRHVPLSTLIVDYTSFLISKLDIHEKYHELQGNYDVSQYERTRLSQLDGPELAQLATDLQDEQDRAIELCVNVMGSMSSVDSGINRCRCGALVPLCAETYNIYQIVRKIIIRCHEIPGMIERMTTIRNRFALQHQQLYEFYFDAGNLKTLTQLTTVPTLPIEAPKFVPHERPPPKVELRPKFEDKFMTFDTTPKAFDFGPTKEQQEINRLLAIIDELRRRIRELEAENDQLRMRIAQLEQDQGNNEALLREVERWKKLCFAEKQRAQELENAAQEALSKLRAEQAKPKVMEDKMKKAMEMYQNLRTEHLNALKQVGVLKRQAQGVDQAKDDYNRLDRESKEEIERLKQRARELSKNLEESLQAKDSGLSTMMKQMEEKDKELADLQAKINELTRVSEEAARAKALAAEGYSSQLDEAARQAAAQQKKAYSQLLKIAKGLINNGVMRFNDPGFNGTADVHIEDILGAKEGTENALKALQSQLVDIMKKGYVAGDDDAVDRLNDAASDLANHLVMLLQDGKGGLRLTDSEDVEKALMESLNDIAQGVLGFLGHADPVGGLSTEESLTQRARELAGVMGKFGSTVESLQPKTIEEDDLEDVIQKEMDQAARAVEEASRAIEEMLAKARAEFKGINLDVNEAILTAATKLVDCIGDLIKKSSVVQDIIVQSGKGTGSAIEFYKKNHRWTEGLISAAKAVGWAAGVLVEFSDGVSSGKGNFEEVIVGGKEVAASTAQLVAASRVKAPRGPQLSNLETSSRSVNAAVKDLVSAAKNAAEMLRKNTASRENLAADTANQLKRMEMQQQVKILQAEKLLEAERKRLADMRKSNYHLNEISDE